MPATAERLTHVDEITLVRDLNTTDPTSRSYKRILDTVVLANLGLVHKIVSKFPIKNQCVSYDDLFQEGVAGLIHGIKKFDTTKGYRLSTYCYNWINAYVRRYFSNHGRCVRIPCHITDAQISLNKQVESLTQDLGRTPTLSEILDVNPDAQRILNDVKAGLSLNQSIGDDSELSDLQGEDTTDSFETAMDAHILLSRLRTTVSERDFDILARRYGLMGYTPATLDEVASVYELTRARIHQIERTLINKARSLV